MKRWGLIVLTACALAAGCDDDNSTGPSSTPLVFTALLSPASEVPAIGNAESVGRGAVQVMFNVTRDSSNAITGGTATFHFQLNDFPGTTSVVGAHIHSAAAGVNGPIVVNTGVTGFQLTNGSGSLNVTSNPVDATLINAIANNPGGYYFNVHSPLNPGGFARGQLVRVQ